MKIFYIIIVLFVFSSCELGADNTSNIESRVNEPDFVSSQQEDLEELDKLYRTRDSIKADTLRGLDEVNPLQSDYVIVDNSNNEHQKVSVSKEDCRSIGFPELSFSFDVPPEYSVEYFSDYGGLVLIKRKEQNIVVSEFAFNSMKLNEFYTLEEYVESFDNEKYFSSIEAKLLDKKYFGSQNHNVLLIDSKDEDSKLYTLGMMIPSLEKDLYLMCALKKKSISVNAPFDKLENQIIKTIIINGVPIKDIVEAYKD